MSEIPQQETFDRVLAHLRGMTSQAMAFGSCRYRTASGDKCAVGCLIPDEIYSSKIESTSALGILAEAEYDVEFVPAIVAELSRHDKMLLSCLQNIHDDEKNWTEGGIDLSQESQIAKLAERLNLKFESAER